MKRKIKKIFLFSMFLGFSMILGCSGFDPELIEFNTQNANSYLMALNNPCTVASSNVSKFVEVSSAQTSVLNFRGKLYDCSITNPQPTPTPTPQPINPPANLTALPSDTLVLLNWDKVNEASFYVVYWGTANGAYTNFDFVIGTTKLIENLNNDTSYNFAVVSKNAYGTSSLSVVSATPSNQVAPLPPTNLTATMGDGQVSFSWKASKNANLYAVYWGTSSKSYSFVAPVSGTYVPSESNTYLFTDPNLQKGTYYYFAVTASNVHGESGYSNEVEGAPCITNCGNPPLILPIKIQVDPTKSDLILTPPLSAGLWEIKVDQSYNCTTNSFCENFANQAYLSYHFGFNVQFNGLSFYDSYAIDFSNAPDAFLHYRDKRILINLLDTGVIAARFIDLYDMDYANNQGMLHFTIFKLN
jgi:hypothetical protein